MHSLVEIRGAEDDWTGLGDARLRRKLQNRLNVRAHRKRKLVAARAARLAGEDDAPNAGAPACSASAPAPPASAQVPYRGCYATTPYFNVSVLPAQAAEQDSLLQTAFQNSISIVPRPPCTLTLAAHALIDLSRMPDKPDRPAHKTEFVLDLPLSSDHLIVIVQFNVLRGLLSNMASLRRVDELRERYPEMAPPLFPAPASDDDDDDSSRHQPPKHDHIHPIPPELLPTHVQRTTPHGDWIDYAPDGQMRDNLIRHEHAFDQDELLRDLLGSVCASGAGGEQGCGLIVWTDPWSPRGWELTEGFARKWGFLVAGCVELLASTNRWRAARGEEPLAVEL
ncbi:DUF3425 domain-containing protein [Microdochium nivale]|nr:DUF3425 domain-containing protein [Microdochium nivale]